MALNSFVFDFHSLNSGTWGTFIELGRDFVLIMIEFDIRNSQISCAVLFSLKFFVLFGLKHDFFSQFFLKMNSISFAAFNSKKLMLSFFSSFFHGLSS